MGLFDSIGSLFGGGGGGAEGYTSKYNPEYEGTLRSGIYNRMGAKPKLDQNGKPTGEYDTSSVGTPVSTAEAKGGYDFRGFDTAAKKMNAKSPFSESYQSSYKPTEYNNSYNPEKYTAATFNYSKLPGQYYNTAFAEGAKGINTTAQGQLQQLKSQIGVRRPGLLLKASEDQTRNTGEQLGSLRNQLMMQKMQSETELGKAEQLDNAAERYKAAGFSDAQAQKKAEMDYQAAAFKEGQGQFGAGEGYKGYQSRADREKNIADESYRRDTGAVDASGKKIGLEMNATNAERDYRDKALEYLQNLFGTTVGSQNTAASIANTNANTRRGQDLSFLSALAK